MNWTFVKFFTTQGLTKTLHPDSPFLQVRDYRRQGHRFPLPAMEYGSPSRHRRDGEYFWYFNNNKARRELNFSPRDPKTR